MMSRQGVDVTFADLEADVVPVCQGRCRELDNCIA
jgi:hypothetical protein